MMDFHAAMETFAEAWVAANTQTPINTDISSQAEPVRNEISTDPPTMVNVDADGTRAVPKSGMKQAPSSLQQPLNMVLAPSIGPGGVKSMPIHCIVEQVQPPGGSTDGAAAAVKLEVGSPKKTSVTAPGGADNLVVEMDTYAILPGTTMFSELVRTALIKIGYTASESMGAKGAIQIKNWKPLSFDTITDNPNCTLDEILGDLTSVATLRIRLCSQSKVIALEEVKEKLLQFLLDRSQMVLSTTGCPIEKKILAQISRGDYSTVLPDERREAFNKWYREQMERNNILPAQTQKLGLAAVVTSRPDSGMQHSSSPASTAVGSAPNYHGSPSSSSASASTPAPDGSFPFRARARTSFDGENEIPRLQKWFAQNQHPSREQMVAYLDELNSLEWRRGQKPLDLSNIIYWFKNARAAVRRATKLSPGAPPDETALETNDESADDRCDAGSNSDNGSVPELPNRNAIYVVTPLHHQEDDDKIEVVQPNEEEEEEDMDSDQRSNSLHGAPAAYHGYKGQSADGIGETNNNYVDMEQEEATDLSLRKDGVPRFRIKREDGADGDYLSAASGSQSPSPNSQGTPNSQCHPHPTIQSSHTALQMAAMSHALSMHHYMHPAALYQTPISYGKDSAGHSPNGSDGISLSDRKKRSRVFIDPLTEIPKLEKWFEEDTHPSSYMIEKYTEELNKSPYRLRFPKLEPKNVQLWFKNHRAKVKRQRLGMEVSSQSPVNHHGNPNDSIPLQ